MSSRSYLYITEIYKYGNDVGIVQQSGLLRTHVEDALGELTNQGLITPDNFTDLCAFITPSSRHPIKPGWHYFTWQQGNRDIKQPVSVSDAVSVAIQAGNTIEYLADLESSLQWQA